MRSVALYGALGALALAGIAPAASGTAAERGGGAPNLTVHGATAGAPDDRAETYGAIVAAGRAAERGVAWAACPAETHLPPPVRCGTVSVPLDYRDPDGEQLHLAVSQVDATGPAAGRQGALLFNPGGPGASGLLFPLLSVKKAATWANAAQAYAFTGFDPRGVGRSAPLSCQPPEEFVKAPTRDPDPVDEADKRSRIADAKAYAVGCAARSGHLLPYVNTLSTARDMDVVRAALHERKLTYYGGSYGTYLGAVYATLFPAHVRRMVLDSVVDPNPRRIWYKANLIQSAAFEGRWEDWRDWVARHDAAYHLGTTADQVQVAYDAARGKLAGAPAGGVVGPGEFQHAYLGAGYYDQNWPGLAAALAAYLRGDPQPLVKAAAPDTEGAKQDENGAAVYTAVECGDAPWPRDWRVWDRDNTDLARRAPFETWDNVWMNLPCAFWAGPHQQPLDVGVDVHDLPPVLLAAAERDAATPYAGALSLHRRLPGSVLLTEKDSGSHGIVYGPNPCVNERVDAYLLHGDTGSGRTMTCGPHPEPTPAAAPVTPAPAPGLAAAPVAQVVPASAATR